MDKTFLGKTLIVTGGASGIGLLTAQCFAQEGGNILADGGRKIMLDKIHGGK